MRHELSELEQAIGWASWMGKQSNKQATIYIDRLFIYVLSFYMMIEMKSRIIPAIAVVAFVAFVLLLLAADVAYPMHIGEPSYYHVARIDCLVAASTCGLVAILAATAAAHF